MKENREFDMLENANDNEVEHLAEIPVLTKKEKKRMLKMSKNKLNKMNRESNIEKQVSGVEQYKRPKWYTFASVAASVVLVGGIVSTAIFLHRNGQVPDIDLMSGVSQEMTDIDFDYATTVEGLFDKINELNLICSGGGVEVDENVVSHYYDETQDESQYAKYFTVTDTRFSTIEEVKEYFKQYVADPLETSEYHSYFVDAFSPAIFREYAQDGSLLFLKRDDAQTNATNIKLDKNDAGVVLVDIKLTDETEINDIYEKSYDFSVPATISDTACTIRGKIVLDDGNWKMSKYSIDFPFEEETTESGTDNLAAYAALSKLAKFDAIANAAKVKVDEDDIKEVSIGDGDSKTYYRVTDERFKKKSDVKEYLSDSFTESFLDDNSYLWGGKIPVFKEIDGSLYYNGGGGGVSRFYFVGAPHIEDETADSFRIDADSSLLDGYIENVQIFCVKEEGKWKVDKYAINEPS